MYDIVCTCTSRVIECYLISSQLKVVELTDALESSGGYTKAQISERVSKFREKLMQVCRYLIGGLVVRHGCHSSSHIHDCIGRIAIL